MKHKFLSLITLLLMALSSYANHISGGEMSYTLVSQSGNNFTYTITLKLFRDGLGGGPPLAGSEAIAIYARGTNALVWSNNFVPRVSFNTIQLTTPGPCIINPPQVIYDVAIYQDNVTLPGTANGYIVTYQRCCRVSGIVNVTNSATTGVTYYAEIPGNLFEATGPANNSAKFLGIDTVVICAGYPFEYITSEQLMQMAIYCLIDFAMPIPAQLPVPLTRCHPVRRLTHPFLIPLRTVEAHL